MKKSRLILFLVVLLLGLAGMYADRLNNENHLQNQRQAVLNEATLVAAKLEGNIQSNLQILRGLLGLVVTEPDLNQARFSEFAEPILRGKSQINNVDLAPNMVIAMIYPYEGNEKAVGFNLGEAPLQKSDVLKAKDFDEMTLTGPINLVQGGQGFIGQIPAYLDRASNEGKPQFWGMISEVINAEKLYEASGLREPDSSLAFALLKTGQETKKTFFGDSNLLSLNPVEASLYLPNTEWKVLAVPKSGWEKTAPSAWWLRLFFLLVAIIIIIQVWMLSERNRKLSIEQKRLRSLFEMSPIGIAFNDLETGGFVDLNDALVKPTGYTKEEFVNLSYWDITPREYEEQEAEQLESLAKKGRYGPYRKEYIKKNGERYPVLLNGVLLKDRNGKEFIWSIIEDISERIENEQRLIEARDAAQIADKAKSEFLATMSHEIRTPLNGVVGMIDLLSRSKLDEEQLRKLGIAKSSAEFLLVVINDILDFSRIEAGKLELEKIDFDIEKLIQELVESFESEVHSKDLSLTTSFERLEHKIFKGDPNRIRQILNNLIGNAIKFTRAGSVEINLSVKEDNGGWRLDAEVKDTGIGIPEKEQKTLFDAFTQVDASTTRKFGGSGLGLAICSKLTGLMGGKISVSSELGKGSSFKFFIKLDSGEMNLPEKEGDSESSKEFSNEDVIMAGKILLVEDNHFNQEVVSMLLQEFGLNIDVAENGVDALEAMKSNPGEYDLILMDCQMPEMDGYEASEKIRGGIAGQDYAEVPIIALTANAMEGDKEKCLAAGMSDYVSKPIDGEVLIQKISQWIKEQRPV